MAYLVFSFCQQSSDSSDDKVSLVMQLLLYFPSHTCGAKEAGETKRERERKRKRVESVTLITYFGAINWS